MSINTYFENQGRSVRIREDWVPFCEVHDGGTFVGEDVLVGVDADVELVAKLPRLNHGASMTLIFLALPNLYIKEEREESTYRDGKSRNSHRPRRVHPEALARGHHGAPSS